MRISPSVLEALENCPAYESSSSEKSSAAEEGTLLHKAVETGNLSILENEEQIHQATRCLEILKPLEAEITSEGQVLREFLIEIGPIQGTLDRAILKDSKNATVVDFKFGRQPVTLADKSPQLQSYTLGLFYKFPTLEKVTVIILQPRLDVLSSCDYHRSDCERIRLRIESIVARAMAEHKQECPNEKSCLYCGRKAICVELHKIAQKTGTALLPLPVVYNPQLMASPKDMARAQILSYILEDWATQVRKMNAERVLTDGIELPGFELRSREGKMTVNETVNAALKLREAFGLTFEQILSASDLSVAQITDLLYAQGKESNKKELRKQIEQTLTPYSTKNERIIFLQKKRGMSNEAILEECR